MNYAPLKKADVSTIHGESLRLLSETGLAVYSPRAVDVFKRAGAEVDDDRQVPRVRLPESMVAEALQKAPEAYTICGRDRKYDITFERGKPPLFGPSGVPHLIWDEKNGRRRNARLRDYIGLVKLLNGLSQVDFISSPCTFTDVPEPLLDLATFFYLADTAHKPFSVDFSGEAGFRETIQMVALLKSRVYADKPFVQFGFCPVISPLRLDRMGTGQLIEAVQAGIPVAPVTMAQTGVNAPATLAGALTLMNAEMLSLVVLTQCAKPGAPILYGTIPGTTNFRSAEMLTASPELSLLNAGATQMAAHYHLPNWATAGRTDAKTLDIQAGYEQAFSVPLVALSGATYISAVGGFLQSVNVLAPEKFVIDDEIVGMTRRVLAGINADKAHRAADMIARIGPGGDYLGEAHTVRYMRSEYYQPWITENSYWEAWQSGGRPSALERARERAADIVGAHSTPHLSPDVVQALTEAVPALNEIIR